MPNVNDNGLNNRAYAASDEEMSDVVRILTINTAFDSGVTIFHVYGEVANNLATTSVANVTLTIDFYDSSGTVLGSVQGHPFLDLLRPGERSPFDITAFDNLATAVRGFSYYKMSKSWDTTEASKPGFLNLSIENIMLDNCNAYHIKGVIGNLGSNYTKNVVITAAFYNEKHQLITSAITAPEKNGLKPGTFSPYEFVVGQDVLPHFSYYSLDAQSVNYSTKDFATLASPMPPPISTSNSNSSDLMVVNTNATTYSTDTGQMIKISGNINDRSYSYDVNSFVLLSFQSISGTELFAQSAPVTNQEGAFSKTISVQKIQLSEPEAGSDDLVGQLYKIKASFEAKSAENTFAVKNAASLANPNTQGCIGGTSFGISTDRLNVYDSNQMVEDSNTGQVTGFPVSEVKVDSPVTIQAKVENEFGKLQQVTTVTQITDSDGVIVFLDVGRNVVWPNHGDANVRVDWTPDSAGKYQIKILTLTGLETPEVLSPAVNTSLSVTDE